MRLGIDLDGVVADFNAGWIRRYNMEYGSELPTDAVKAWDAIPSLTHFEDMGEFWKWARDHDGHTLFRHLDTYPGAVDALKGLSRNARDRHHHHQARLGNPRHLRLDRPAPNPHLRSSHQRRQMEGGLRLLSRRRPPRARLPHQEQAGGDDLSIRPTLESSGGRRSRHLRLGPVCQRGRQGCLAVSRRGIVTVLAGGSPIGLLQTHQGRN